MKINVGKFVLLTSSRYAYLIIDFDLLTRDYICFSHHSKFKWMSWYVVNTVSDFIPEGYTLG